MPVQTAQYQFGIVPLVAQIAAAFENLVFGSVISPLVFIGNLIENLYVAVSRAVGLGRDRGFDIWNSTTEPILIYSYEGETDELGSHPAPGTLIQPGKEVQVFVNQDPGYDHLVLVNIESQTAGWTVDLKTHRWDGQGATESWCQAGTCSPRSDRAWIDILGPKQTVVVPADQLAQQTQLLTTFCVNDSRYSCSFTPTKQTQVWIDRHIIEPFTNPLPATKDLEITDTKTVTVSTSDSIEIAGKAEFTVLAKAINLAINGKWNHQLTTTATYTNTLKYSLAPGYGLNIYSSAPAYADTGTINIQVGNATYQLVHTFDSLITDANPKLEYITFKCENSECVAPQSASADLNSLKVDVPDPTRTPGVTRTETPPSDDPTAIV